ncbi:Shedu anti-phage system protein SduA domain-containing protein [Nocardia sp. NPDC060259]|uniref:Shedu anti-phage system protein SduA domain-containing protein n=1 Tax=Nocardia sp. NPDC060259 TaxID=3347088 RepID=UPI003661DDBE
MGFRSSFTLVELLRATRTMIDEPEVHRLIDEAIEFTTNGPDSGGHRYLRGKPLITHLMNASSAAARSGRPDISNRLSDFADYASGNIHLSLLETRYMPGRRESEEKFMRVLLEVGLRRCAELLNEYVKDRPEASAAEAAKWLDQVSDAMERWTIGEDRLGGVQLPRNASAHLAWLRHIQLVLNDPCDRSSVDDTTLAEIADMPGSDVIAQAVQWNRRRAAIATLRAVVEDPVSLERDIHSLLRQQTWLFGGRYVKELARRQLTTMDEFDIPLLRGDGSLHIVELKKAMVPNLVEQPRTHCSAGLDVHRAVTQAANYLRSLDENRAAILADYGIECRRAFATVVIGHPKFVDRRYSASEVAGALRTYNATLSRIEVITYQELIDSAERLLTLDDRASD